MVQYLLKEAGADISERSNDGKFRYLVLTIVMFTNQILMDRKKRET